MRVLEYYGERPDMMLHLKFLIDATKTTKSGPEGMFGEWGALKEGPEFEGGAYVLIPAAKVGDAARFYGVSIVPSDREPLPPVPLPNTTKTAASTAVPTSTPTPTPEKVSIENLDTAKNSSADNDTIVEKVSAQKIEVILSFAGGERKATVSNENGEINLEAQGVSAKVDFNSGFSLDQNGIMLKGQPVKLLPDKALATASAFQHSTIVRAVFRKTCF
ncbi:MAG: hypothetical protein QXR53_04320 [Candidatus Norongarragalinales archaeon]